MIRSTIIAACLLLLAGAAKAEQTTMLFDITGWSFLERSGIRSNAPARLELHIDAGHPYSSVIARAATCENWDRPLRESWQIALTGYCAVTEQSEDQTPWWWQCQLTSSTAHPEDDRVTQRNEHLTIQFGTSSHGSISKTYSYRVDHRDDSEAYANLSDFWTEPRSQWFYEVGQGRLQPANHRPVACYPP